MDPELFSLIAQNALRLDGGARLDATQTAFLARELEQVRNVSFDVEYPASRTLSYLPLATDIDPLAQSFVWEIWNKTGQADLWSGESSDVPAVEVSKREETGKTYLVASSYGFSVMDLRRAARFGSPLTTKKVEAVQTAIDTTIDEILRTGNLASTGKTLGLHGFVDDDAVDDNPGVLSNWLAGATTAQNIIDDLETIVWAPRIRTNDMHVPDTLLLAPELYRAATGKKFSYNGASALKEFLAGHPEIRMVDAWTRLSGAGGSAKHRAIAYKRTAQVLEAVVPIRFEQLPPQQLGMKISTVCFASCGGVLFHLPAAVQYADFANAA